jgi:chromatin remodeling complex protein RSC6
MKELKMAEAKGLSKPVKLKNELAEFLVATELPRTEITKKLWDYIKANKLQTRTENGKAENAGKFIVADAKLLPIFKNTKSKSKSGKVTDLTKMKEGLLFIGDVGRIKKICRWHFPKPTKANFTSYFYGAESI